MAMLHFQINTHSGVPVYRQIIDQIKYYVASGTLKGGDLLPSIRELAQALVVNPTTVVRAYSELEQERVIEMQHGRGAFVADAARRMTAVKREQALRRSARQLAVEAFQIGASSDLVFKIVQEELEALQGTENLESGEKVSVVGRNKP